MNITIKIDDKRIRELISEAGSRYWARDLEFKGKSMAFTITEHGDGDITYHTVTTKMIRDGLTKMANMPHNEGGHHFSNVCDWTQSDSWTGDAIIQFAIFGELKYG
jgi:hypothetical protein